MLRRAREDPLFLDAPSVLYRTFNELTGADLAVPRQKEHNNMCLAIEKMKEKGRQEEQRKALKAIEGLDVATIFINVGSRPHAFVNCPIGLDHHLIPTC